MGYHSIWKYREDDELSFLFIVLFMKSVCQRIQGHLMISMTGGDEIYPGRSKEERLFQRNN
ncbi:hypothetical protein [Halobacillus litoralis]|uniref:hypothetical protein n=1 Tax=Halobacillus litoralis TaxID=45668 RepID=UPI001CD7283F|nr:hypothetical protein [Halobacillus litoralis]MCA1022875.1 hypothetical protein [Halobacillus litoralis]